MKQLGDNIDVVLAKVEQMGRQADQYPGIQSKQYVQNPAAEHRWKR
jgi:hypothetical protein